MREIFGNGTFFGVQVMPESYQVNNFLLLPPSSFIIIGLFIWAIREYKPAQVEEDEFKVSKHSSYPDLTKKELNV